MNLRKLTFRIIAMSLLSVSSAIAAGTLDGGGGKGVICDGKLRVLDVYEADEVYHFKKGPRDGDLKATYWTSGIRVFQEIFPYYLSPELIAAFFQWEPSDALVNKFAPIPTGHRLQPTSDVTLPKIPRNCQFIQIARIEDNKERIDIDLEYWNMLDPFNKAVLLVHEQLYRYLREIDGISSSDDTRRLVAKIMSAEPHIPMFTPLWKAKKHVYCISGSAEQTQIQTWPAKPFNFIGIDEIRNGKLGLALYFGTFNSVTMLHQTKTFLEGLSLDNLKMARQVKFISRVANSTQSLNQLIEIIFSKNEKDSSDFTKADVLSDFNFDLRILAENLMDSPFNSGMCKIFDGPLRP